MSDESIQDHLEGGMIAVTVRLDEWIGSSLLDHKFKYQTTELQLFLQYVPVLFWYPLDIVGTSRIELSDCIFRAAVRNPLHGFSTRFLLLEMINILFDYVDDYSRYKPSLLIEKLKTTDFQSFEKGTLKRLLVGLLDIEQLIEEPFQEDDSYEYSPCILKDNPLNDDEEFVLEVINQDSLALGYASDRLKENEEIVLEAIQQNGFSLQLASEKLKDNEIVLEAIKQIGSSLDFASDRLKDNEEFVLKAVREFGNALNYASDRLKDNELIVLQAVKKDGFALNCVSDRLKDNEDIVLAAVKQHGCALVCASDRLKENEEMVFEAIKQNGNALEIAPDELRDNEEIVLEAVKQSGGLALEFASDRLRNDFNFINEILKSCNSLQIFQCIAEKFRNIEFIYYYIQNYESHFHELVRKT